MLLEYNFTEYVLCTCCFFYSQKTIKLMEIKYNNIFALYNTFFKVINAQMFDSGLKQININTLYIFIGSKLTTQMVLDI